MKKCYAMILMAVMACATIIGLSTSAQAAQVNYTSWTAVSQAIIDQLQDGKQEYESGNTAGATSDFMSAYNTVYVGANFSTVVQQTISSETFTSQQQQFQNIQNYSYTTGNNVEIDAAISVLSQDLTTTAEQLDANTELKNPSEYAKDLEKQIQEERKKLDAAKSKKEGRGSRTWTQIAEQMNEILDNAYKAYQGGHVSHGVELVNEAYYQYYEKLGFEKNVMNAISGNRVSQVEYTFKLSRQSISNKKPASEVKNYITSLKAMLLEDAKTLDGSTGNVNPVTQFVTSSFGQAFLILLREGLEAILVVAAIIAYLVKSGNKKFIRYIYLGLVAGLVGSGIIAIIFMMLFNGNGPEQEIMEGVVALIAMVMLLYTSNWMLSRSSTQAWDEYIKKETAIAVSRGSVISLALLSFLAVFREGAETVMFYQAIFSMTSGSTTGIWAGFVSASISLIIIFLIIRFTSIKIPIRPFFITTSVLMALLVIIFAGGGVHALIEGELLSGMYVAGVPTNDWLGLYPYAETLIAQAVAIVAVLVLGIIAVYKQHALNNKKPE